MFGKDYISKPPRTRPELGYWTTIWVAYMTNGKDWGWGLQLGSSSPSMQNSTSSTRWLLYMHNIRPQSVTSNADATLEFGSHFDYSCISNTLKCVLFNPSNVIYFFRLTVCIHQVITIGAPSPLGPPIMKADGQDWGPDWEIILFLNPKWSL